MKLAKGTELIEINFDYKGSIVEAEIHRGKDGYGMFYTVFLKCKYAYTLHYSENGKWLLVNESDNSLSLVEGYFLQMLTRQLSWECMLQQ
jgi:hypothetical protein